MWEAAVKDLRHPSPVPILWVVLAPFVPPHAIVVEARLAIDARAAAKLYLTRQGWPLEQVERVQVGEWRANGRRWVRLNEGGEEVGTP
jgi:hypothetical protein